MLPGIFLFALLVAPLRAPANKQDTFNMPCSAVVKLGLTKFVAAFAKATHDDSEAGTDAATVQYGDCKRKANDAASQKLTSTQRIRVARLRGAIEKIEDGYIALSDIEAGGGTMYAHETDRIVAPQEDALGAVIAAILRPSQVPPSRQSTALLSKRIAAKMARLRRAPKPDPLVLKTENRTLSQFLSSVKQDNSQIGVAVADVTRLTMDFPRSAQLVTDRYIYDTLNLFDQLQ